MAELMAKCWAARMVETRADLKAVTMVVPRES
jgi:hypothetical protein